MRPRIEIYASYRLFLHDYIANKQENRTGFSFRRLTTLAGLKSPNFLAQVIQGQKNMSQGVARNVAAALKLDAKETECLVALVDMENADSDALRDDAYRRALRARKELVARTIPSSSLSQVVQYWWILVVRELVFLSDFSPNGHWISQRMCKAISEIQAEEALMVLLRTGFLEIDKEGRWRAAEPVVDTGNDIPSRDLLLSHVQVYRHWAEILPRLNSDSHELGVINIPMNPDKIPELRSRMRRFQDEIIGWLQDETQPTAVVQVGCGFIKVT